MGIYWPVLLLVNIGALVANADVHIPRPKGLSLAKASLYDASKPFRCFDGSNEVPFSYVNDDYCDCLDGSDEPGTAACSNGFFHCTNRGYKSVDIPSSRVNDGVCDCCDGSDEYDEKISCPNTCMELGRQMREEAQRQIELLRRGYQKRQEYVDLVKGKKAEKLTAVEALEKQLKDLEGSKETLVMARDEAEKPEKEAIAKHKDAWEAAKQQKLEQRERAEFDQAFNEIAGDKDVIPAADLLAKIGDENMTEDLKETVNSLSQFTKEDVYSVVWPKMKSWYKSATVQNTTPAPTTTTTTPPPEPEIDEGYEPEYTEDGHHHEHHHDHEDDNEAVDLEEFKRTEQEDDKMPEYPTEVKQLIEVADKARQDLKDVEDNIYKLSSEKNGLKRWLDNDYGPDNVFAAIEGECFEYTDREYTYKLCPFDRVTQRPKDGGSETSLGTWGHWENGFAEMRFTDGARCWNGPSRSTKIRLQCAEENHLGSASEPSRCEYEMTFGTPAVCSQPIVVSEQFEHDEL